MENKSDCTETPLSELEQLKNKVSANQRLGALACNIYDYVMVTLTAKELELLTYGEEIPIKLDNTPYVHRIFHWNNKGQEILMKMIKGLGETTGFNLNLVEERWFMPPAMEITPTFWVMVSLNNDGDYDDEAKEVFTMTQVVAIKLPKAMAKAA